MRIIGPDDEEQLRITVGDPALLSTTLVVITVVNQVESGEPHHSAFLCTFQVRVSRFYVSCQVSSPIPPPLLVLLLSCFASRSTGELQVTVRFDEVLERMQDDAR